MQASERAKDIMIQWHAATNPALLKGKERRKREKEERKRIRKE
jgi:hypothetical protein